MAEFRPSPPQDPNVSVWGGLRAGCLQPQVCWLQLSNNSTDEWFGVAPEVGRSPKRFKMCHHSFAYPDCPVRTYTLVITVSLLTYPIVNKLYLMASFSPVAETTHARRLPSYVAALTEQSSAHPRLSLSLFQKPPLNDFSHSSRRHIDIDSLATPQLRSPKPLNHLCEGIGCSKFSIVGI